MPGAVLSLILIRLLRYGMSLLNIQGQVQSVLIGLRPIGSILLPNLLRNAAQHKGRRLSGGRRGGQRGQWLPPRSFSAFFFWLLWANRARCNTRT